MDELVSLAPSDVEYGLVQITICRREMYSGVGKTREEMTQILILRGASLLLLQTLLILCYSRGLSLSKEALCGTILRVDIAGHLQMLTSMRLLPGELDDT